MPYKSKKREHLFEGCRNNSNSMSNCPPKKVVEEFHQATYHPEKRRDVALPKARKVTYH